MRTLLPLLLLLAAPAVVLAAPDPPVPPAGSAPEPGSLEKLLASRPVVNGPLTMDQAVETALRESPVVRGAVEEVEAAAGWLAAARAERRPWVSANLFASGGNNTNIVAGPAPTQPQMIMGLPKGGFFEANLMAMVPLFTSGRLQAMVRQAAAQRDASKADLESQRQEVALMVRMAYREALARRSLVEVWRARLQEDEERLRLDREKVAAGRIPAFYVQRDEAEVAATRQDLTNAGRDVELSLLQLRTVMGVSPASRIEIPGSLEYQSSADFLSRLAVGAPAPAGSSGASPSALPPDLASLLRLAERQRPELQASALRTRAVTAETASLRGAYGPQVSLFAMGDALTEEPHGGLTAGVAASFPLFNGGQRRARLQTAGAERRRQEQEQQRIALQVSQEVSAALLNLRAAEQNIATAQAALVAAREDYRVAAMRYDAGRSIGVEVLDALTARVRAESNVVQALFQYNVQRDRLLRAVGEPVGAASPVPGSGSIRR
jgi:outer membrane protein TolC